MYRLIVFLALVVAASAQQYELLIKGGHLIDPKNSISKPMDVAISQGKIAAVDENIPVSHAKRIVDGKGLYVSPGLIDIHVHVYAGTGSPGVIAGDSSIYPDTFSFRSGTTTMVDAGSSGFRNFPDFKDRVIRRAKTRVLALLNIVGGGMGTTSEFDTADMDPEAAAKMARENPDIIVGFKSAHYTGKGWPSVEGAVKAGKMTNLPVMIDFGYVNEERNISTLFMDKLRPGDIYTHCFSGHRDEVLNGKLNPAMEAGRKRGIIFDIGHGGGSFYWPIALRAYEAKFAPDSISTDLHTGSMNAGMKDMVNVMSKILNLGSSIEDVIKMSTWNPANEIKHPELGHLSVGAPADVTLLKLEKGMYGFLDSAGARRTSSQRLIAEVTVRDGQVVWDLNGRGAVEWDKFTYRPRPRP